MVEARISNIEIIGPKVSEWDWGSTFWRDDRRTFLVRKHSIWLTTLWTVESISVVCHIVRSDVSIETGVKTKESI